MHEQRNPKTWLLLGAFTANFVWDDDLPYAFLKLLR
jgi:hypothetical protein